MKNKEKVIFENDDYTITIPYKAHVNHLLDKHINFYRHTTNPTKFTEICDNGAKSALIALKEELGFSLSSEEIMIRYPQHSYKSE